MISQGQGILLSISLSVCFKKNCMVEILSFRVSIFPLYLRRRNLNYFSSAYTAAVSAVDPDAGHGELVIKVPSELWKQGDGKIMA